MLRKIALFFLTLGALAGAQGCIPMMGCGGYYGRGGGYSQPYYRPAPVYYQQAYSPPVQYYRPAPPIYTPAYYRGGGGGWGGGQHFRGGWGGRR